MEQNKKQEKKKLASCVIGQAQVVFGGAVQVGFGSMKDNEDAVVVGLSELKHPCPQAGMEPENDETFGVQVMLVFPDLPTLTNFRGILDEVETALKSRMKDEMEAPGQADTLRRWTIGDACNGDVLVCRHPKGHEGPCESIFIFRKVADRDYVRNAVEYHCRLFDDKFQLAGQGYMGALEKASDSDYYRPATAAETKQMWEAVQRAGYEWDTESGKLLGME